MPRGQLTKEHLKMLILQQKNKLESENCDQKSKELAHKHFNKLIDKLQEFRY